jgi:hypothetical protein
MSTQQLRRHVERHKSKDAEKAAVATEPRRPSRRGVFNIFDSFNNPDFVAVCVVAIIGLLMTILMAQIFPLDDKAIDLLLLSN